ncbi:sodium/proline symporter PutP [Entomomonas moraniae]|uniref:Sodium/proline symporter n=1 Tax=Entomomonas moraniae TaxID=2213226 RepID=A0A3S9XDN5_9GAMM|nr:sodium/proline symporter PutP [Entomomonas moraniae]AZS50456.1 sodium/proline symporter PutP [Entomomonas moraniae]
MSANYQTTVTFVLYIILMILIGLYAYRSTKNFDDYILGGRSLGSLVTALSAGASDMSGWLLMGLPGAIYLSGLSEVWIAIGLTLGAWLNWLLVAGRLRVHTEYNDNALTLPDYFTSRFDDHTRLLRIFSALVILIFFTLYCASGIVAGARLFESIFDLTPFANNVNNFLGISLTAYHIAMFLGAVATIIYVCIGGFLAVSWTDTVQASLMLFALILTPVFVIISLSDWNTTVITIEKTRQNIDVFNLFAVKGETALIKFIAIISLVAWGLGYFGQPHILVRFMAADSVKSMPNARRIGMIWMILCLLGAVSAGFFGIAYFANYPDSLGATIVNKNSEYVFIELSKALFNPWVVGVILSGILAAVMSTLSCQLLVCSSALTEDFYKPFFRKNASQRELVWVGRAMVLIVAALAIFLSRDPNSRVLGMVSYAWAGFGAAFGPVILLSLFYRQMTKEGALVGMILGALTVLVWKQYEWFNLYEIVPGFVLNMLAIFVVSSVTKPTQKVLDTFDQASKEYTALTN